MCSAILANLTVSCPQSIAICPQLSAEMSLSMSQLLHALENWHCQLFSHWGCTMCSTHWVGRLPPDIAPSWQDSTLYWACASGCGYERRLLSAAVNSCLTCCVGFAAVRNKENIADNRDVKICFARIVKKLRRRFCLLFVSTLRSLCAHFIPTKILTCVCVTSSRHNICTSLHSLT